MSTVASTVRELAPAEPATPEAVEAKLDEFCRRWQAIQHLHGHAHGRDGTPVAHPSGETFYPAVLCDRPWWTNWVKAHPVDDDGEWDPDGTATKQPVAPYDTGHANPVAWHFGLGEDEHPTTTFERVERWVGWRVGSEVPASERVVSDELGASIIIPVDQPTATNRRSVLLLDWDNVRDPETGALHPVCAWALRECDGYAEVSQSGAGIHQLVFGEIPGGFSKFIRHIDDEPWVPGSDDRPQVEMYASGRLCAMTGRHVAGTKRDVRDGQDLVNTLVWAFGDGTNNSTTTPTDPFAAERTDEAAAEPATTAVRTSSTTTPTTEAAAERLRESVAFDGDDPADWDVPPDRSLEYVAVLRARERSDELPTTANWELIGYAAAFGHALGLDQTEVVADLRAHPTPQYGFDRQRAEKEVEAVYRKCENGQYVPPSRTRLADRGLLPERYAEDHGYAPGDGGGSGGGEYADLVPRETLDGLLRGQTLDAAADAARRRGLEWPDEPEVRQRTTDVITTAMRDEETITVRAPTGSGKSHTVATTPWLDRGDVTGGEPVVQLHHNTATRDAKYAESEAAHGVTPAKLLGAHEACPVYAGDHDDEITIDGLPASEWFREQREKHVPFSLAHNIAFKKAGGLPCCDAGEADSGSVGPNPGDPEDACPAKAQWAGVPRSEASGDPTVDVIHATHPFLYAPSLANKTNVVLDERPDFTLDLDDDGERIRRSITAFLREVEARVDSFESLVSLGERGFTTNEHHPAGKTAGEKYDKMDDTLRRTPPREWFTNHPHAHFYAPGIARAIWYAVQDDPDENGRRAQTVPYHPPRLDATAGDGEGWNRVWVTVVLGHDNTFEHIRVAPDLSQARSVVGLDAAPNPYLWQRNVHPDISIERVLTPREAQLYTLFERRQVVLQVGDARRPLTSERAAREWLGEDRLRAELSALRDAVPGLHSAITTMNAEAAVAELLADAGAPEEAIETMHYGAELGRDDFGDHPAGAVIGAHDCGDDPVLNLLAEMDLDATPERSDTPCESCGDPPPATDGDDEPDPRDGCPRCGHTGWKRARGDRAFAGPDADDAEAILRAFSHGHVQQAVGRYARGDRGPECDPVPVFVFTNDLPPGLAHVSLTGAAWVYGPKQRAVAEYLRTHGRATVPEAAGDLRAAAADGEHEFAYITDEHVRNTLNRLAENGVARTHDGLGPNGATVYLLTGPGLRDLSGPARYGVLGTPNEGDGNATLDVFAGAASHSRDALVNSPVQGPSTSQFTRAPGVSLVGPLRDALAGRTEVSAPADAATRDRPPD